jgi:hypothetical protein
MPRKPVARVTAATSFLLSAALSSRPEEDDLYYYQAYQNHTFDNNSMIHTYVVKHDICENWSLHIKGIIEHF